MPDVLKNPHVQALLRDIGAAEERRDPQGADHAQEVALARLHTDLGRAVAQFAAVHASYTLLPPDGGGRMATSDLYTSENEDDSDTNWYTDDVSRAPGPLFDPGDIDDDTDIPEPDARPRFDDANADDMQADEDFDVENVARMQFRRDDPDSPMAQLSADPAPTWLHHVEQFRELLALPNDFDNAAELAVETSKVQWAAGELHTRLSGLPAEIQVCFIGLLGARSQWLMERLDVTVGARLSLDRLNRYRLSADLPSVAALEASARPEYGSWENDVLQWWTVLTPAPPESP